MIRPNSIPARVVKAYIAQINQASGTKDYRADGHEQHKVMTHDTNEFRDWGPGLKHSWPDSSGLSGG